MASIPVKVSKTGPGLFQLARDLQRIRGSEILVGIPATQAQRRGDPVNNASLLFIHTHGSELRHIPPRPVLEPAIEANRETITPHLARAAKDVMQRNVDHADQELRRAGVVASNAAKRWFTDSRNAWQPNAPTTINAKGSDKPLLNTGQMRRAITYVVRVNP